MKPTLLSIPALTLLLAWTNAATAAVIEQVVNVPSAEVDINTTSGSSGQASMTNGSFTFSGFDTTLGTLTGITIVKAVTLTFSGTLTNTLASSTTFKFSDSSKIQIANPPVGVTTDPYATVTYNPTTFTLAAGAMTQLAAQTSTSPSTPFTVLAGNYTSYENGPINFNVATSNTPFVDNASGTQFLDGIQQQLTITGAGSYTLDYTYTPNIAVPEPASIGLLLVGLLGLGGTRLRRTH